MQISKVLMYSDVRFQLWLQRDCFFVVFADGTMDKKCLPDSEDLFVLPMNGLVRLAQEYIEELRPRLANVRAPVMLGPDIGADGEFFLQGGAT